MRCYASQSGHDGILRVEYWDMPLLMHGVSFLCSMSSRQSCSMFFFFERDGNNVHASPSTAIRFLRLACLDASFCFVCLICSCLEVSFQHTVFGQTLHVSAPKTAQSPSRIPLRVAFSKRKEQKGKSLGNAGVSLKPSPMSFGLINRGQAPDTRGPRC